VEYVGDDARLNTAQVFGRVLSSLTYPMYFAIDFSGVLSSSSPRLREGFGSSQVIDVSMIIFPYGCVWVALPPP
jgi:hypothetical protein